MRQDCACSKCKVAIGKNIECAFNTMCTSQISAADNVKLGQFTVSVLCISTVYDHSP